MTPLADPLDAAVERWRLPVRALRGATTVTADEPARVRAATTEPLAAMLRANALPASRVISAIVTAIFTVTPDLRSEFPARAARAPSCSTRRTTRPARCLLLSYPAAILPSTPIRYASSTSSASPCTTTPRPAPTRPRRRASFQPVRARVMPTAT